MSIGGSAYPRAPRLRHDAFAASSRAIASSLNSGGGALVKPEHHLDLFDDDRAWPDQLMAIKDWLTRTTNEDGADPIENIIAHYVGHGQFRRNTEDHVLTINSTDPDHVIATSASLHQLNDVLKKSTVQRRIYLVDACFAAASTRDLMGAPDETFEVDIGGVIGAWPQSGQRGVAALCSADKLTTADAGGQRGLTQFTDGLLSVLEGGDRGSPGPLTLRHVHWLLRRLLKERYGDNAIWPALVAPDDTDGGIGAIPLFPNQAGAPAGSPSDDAKSAGPPADPQPSEAAPESFHERDERLISEKVVAGGPPDRSPAAGEASDARMEESLSPEQRFRQATYRFFRLPRSAKADIAEMLHVDLSGAQLASDLDRYKAILARARDEAGVDRLEMLIGKAERS